MAWCAEKFEMASSLTNSSAHKECCAKRKTQLIKIACFHAPGVLFWFKMVQDGSIMFNLSVSQQLDRCKTIQLLTLLGTRLEKLEPFPSLSPRSWPQDQQELGAGQLGKDRFDMAW